MQVAKAGDTILLRSDKDRRLFIKTLEPGRKLQTHRGLLLHDELINKPIGSQVYTQLGFAYYVLKPTTEELIRNLPRESQIIFPKDAGYIILKLGVRPGSRVIEAGTGSGGLTIALATAVGQQGRVFSYDFRETMQDRARRNLELAGSDTVVEFRLKDIMNGFDEHEVDSVFLDLLTPERVLDSARTSLRGGGVLGCLVPTANQVIEMVRALQAHLGFEFVQVEELLLRSYKSTPSRLRPNDRMVGHTGYLIFARAVIRIPKSDLSTSMNSV